MMVPIGWWTQVKKTAHKGLVFGSIARYWSEPTKLRMVVLLRPASRSRSINSAS